MIEIDFQYNTYNSHLLFYGLCFSLNLLIVCLVMRKVRTIDLEKRIYSGTHHASSKRIVSNLGGVSILIPFFIINAILNHWLNSELLHVIQAAVILIFFTGLRDDLVKWHPGRITVTEIACIVLVLFLEKFRMDSLNGLFGVHELPEYWGYILPVIIMLFTLTTAVQLNRTEGLLPIIGGCSFFIFGLSLSLLHIFALAAMCFGLTGNLWGFILFQNRNRTIILGKSGALLTGFLLGYISVFLLCYNGTNQIAVKSVNKFILNIPFALSFILLPVFDFIRRLLLALFWGARWNCNMPVQDRLIKQGYSKMQTALLIGSINATLISLACYLIYLQIGIVTILCTLWVFSFFILALCLKLKPLKDPHYHL